MTASITVSPSPAPATPAAPAVSVSADVAKAYADAVAEAKAEIAKVEASLKGDEGTVVSWFKANYQHVVTWALAAGGGVSGLLELAKHI